MQETIDKINEAYANRERVRADRNEYKAVVDGIEIKMYLDGSDKTILCFLK